MTPVVCASVAELDIRDEKHSKREGGVGLEGRAQARGGVQVQAGYMLYLNLRFKKEECGV